MNFYQLYDHYEGFMTDYYEVFRWLTRLKQKYPSHKIGIKHHWTANKDEYEAKIINNSGVDLIDKYSESYNLVKKARVIATYASTLGYESFLLNKRCLFLDPLLKNNFIAYQNENKIIDKYRVTDFEEFENKYNLIIKNDRDFLSIEKSDLDEIITYSNDPYSIMYNTIKEFG